MVDHGVVVGRLPAPRLAQTGRLRVSSEVHVSRIDPAENGLPAACWRLIQSLAAATNSSSQLSMRFLLSGPVSSIFCLPTRPQRGCSVGSSFSVAQQWRTPRGPNFALNCGNSFGSGYRVLGVLFGVEVIEVAVELVKAMHRRQEPVLIAEVVLAELAGRVTERLEQFRDGRILRLLFPPERRGCRPWRGRCERRSAR